MPLPEINAFAPGDVFLRLDFTDIGAAGGASGTLRFAAPMRGFVKWVGICPANPLTGGAGTTITVKCGALTAMTSASMGVLIPTTIVERGYYVFRPPQMNPLNFFERAALITIASGGETTVASTATCQIVLGAL